jgi:hypothetical protein
LMTLSVASWTIWPNKALQLTPSRHALLSYDRFSFPSTSPQEFCA